jgi:hypothetical protein
VSRKILTGVIENDSWFAYVGTLDPCEKCAADGKTAPNPECSNCDNWTDEATWVKANPGIDAILPRVYLREQVTEAVEMPSKENIVRRPNFCQWTEQAIRWIPMADGALVRSSFRISSHSGRASRMEVSTYRRSSTSTLGRLSFRRARPIRIMSH